MNVSETSTFQSFEFCTGKLTSSNSSILYAFKEEGLSLKPNSGFSSYFGYVFEGESSLSTSSGSFSLKTGMYFCCQEEMQIQGGQGLVIEQQDFRGFFHLGGPVEEKGRLRYIDGCSDSLLIPPVMQGDPCLNLLYFPPKITQTPHTHPSVRLGVVSKGKGFCVLPDQKIPLTPGTLFVIYPEAVHSFETHSEPMSVIAFHPDSDFGPTHEDHPMLNRTIVNGVSAKYLESLQTKDSEQSFKEA